MLSLQHTQVHLLPEDIMSFAKSPELRYMIACNHNYVNFSRLLREMPLAELATQLEAKQLDYFTTLETDGHALSR